MSKLLLFPILFFSFCLFSQEENPYETAVFGGEPNSIVAGCVSAITGEFFINEEDLVVRGHEPIHIQRRYYSRNGKKNLAGWKYGFNHLWAAFTLDYWIEIPEKTGMCLLYTFDRQDSSGKRHYKLASNLGGLTNCSMRELSARLNACNNKVFHQKKQKELIIECADGSSRKYKTDVVETNPLLKTHYVLVRETLANGNRIDYTWEELFGEKFLKEVKTTSAKGKVFAWARFSHDLRDRKHCFSKTVTTSDGRKICYQFDPHFKHKKKRHHLLKNVTFSNRPTEEYSFWAAEKGGVCLSFKKLPDQRHLNIRYYRLGENKGFDVDIPKEEGESHPHYKRVKLLMQPTGEDSSLFPAYRFFYTPGKYKKNAGFTEVYDAYDNLTRYHYDAQFRLIKIEHCIGKTEIFSQEIYDWNNKGWLCSKTLLGRKQQPVFKNIYHYDEKGNVIETECVGNFTGESDEEHFSITRSFYPNLLLKTETYPNGKVIEYHYLDKTDLLTKTFTYHKEDPNTIQERTFYAYDDSVLIEKICDDGETRDKKNLQGVTQRLITRIIPRTTEPYIALPDAIEESYYEPQTGETILLSRKTIRYNLHGQVVEVNHYDNNGDFSHACSYTYDARGRLKTRTDPLGREHRVEYDKNDNPITSDDPDQNFLVQTAFDYSNRPCRVEKVAPNTAQATINRYNYLNQKIASTDPQGNTTYTTYDPFGHPTRICLPTVKGKSAITEKTYNTLGKPITSTNALGHTTHTAYTFRGDPYHIIHPNGDEDHYTYTLEGHLKTHTNPRGTQTHYTHDLKGRVTSKTIIENDTTLSTERYTYNAFHLIKYTAPDGVETHMTYNGAGQKTKEQTLDRITTYSYDSLGRLEKTICGPQVYTKQYDLLNRVIREEERDLDDNLYSYTTYTYDNFGNKTKLTKEVHTGDAVQTYEYDPFKREILYIDPLGHETHTTYNDHYQDSHHQTVIQKTIRDPLGHLTIQTYDPLGHLTSLEKISNVGTPLLQETFTYDLNGNKISQTSHLLKENKTITKSWEYDSRDRLIALHEPHGKTTIYTYTPNGHLKTTTKPDGVSIIYTYNGLGWKTSTKTSDNTCYYTFSYDALGNITNSYDHIHHQTTRRTYNHFGELLTETLANGLTTHRTYDALGRKTQLQLPQATITYTYDPYHLISVTRLTPQGEPCYTHTYDTYDLSHNLLQENGNTYYTYDLLSRPVRIETPTITQSLPHIDPNGNILTYIRNDEITSYAYDPLNQLTHENNLSYSYDSHHNRISKNGLPIPINDLNQITHHTYDPNGNTLSDHIAQYTYDGLNRLIHIQKDSQNIHLTYDSWGRCHTLTTTPYYPWQSSKSEPLLYDDQNELGIHPYQLRILGSSHSAETGATILLELHGHPYIPIHDPFGNIITIRPLSTTFLWGPSQETYHLTTFGEEQSSSQINPWRYQSKRHLSHLVYFGRRFYHPQTGRWLSPDPKGFSEGPNLYQFLQNNPHLSFDPYGEFLLRPFKDPDPSSWNCSQTYLFSLEPSKQAASAALNNPRVQGAAQAFGGLTEAVIGGSATVASYGAATPITALVMAHGLDRFFTGIRMMTTGEFYDTATAQLLQKAGLSPQMSRMFDDMASIIGSLGSTAYIYNTRSFSSLLFQEHATSTIMKNARRDLPSYSNPFHQASSTLSKSGQNNIRILRGWAKSKGWKKLPNPNGGPEKWGHYNQLTNSFHWNLKIKPKASLRPGLAQTSSQARFDARIGYYPSYDYINPFTGEIGSRNIGTHIPLE